MSTQQRIFELDALRGFSLLGIVLMNILTFSMPYEESFLPDLVKGIDQSILRVITLLVISSFYPIFTFLFGYSLAIMYKHSQRRAMKYYPFIYRRLTFLLILGALHGFLLFSGDILFSYAFTGMIAVLCIKKSSKKLFKIGVILYAIKVFILILPTFLVTYLDDPYSTINISGFNVSEIVNLKQSGEYFNYLKVNVIENTYNIIDTITFSAYFEFLPYVFLGMSAQKYNLVEKVQFAQNRHRHVLYACLMLIVGYAFKMPYVVDIGNQAFAIISAMIGGPLVAFGYILLFIYCCRFKQFSKTVNIFKYPGKLSLTVYLMQSFIFTFIYVGLGLYNKLPLYESYLIVLVVYSLQLIFCYVYLKFYRYGPIEWLWRKVTYLK
ncbi:DUF418 domain-containing protein [Staphylococcus ureilyticus]|uniref:DUF418 domain-containing protein n=1 Tax=Staphylococcus ureilyticus TaxID=94138 RepID=UPI0021CEF478|nr:DUF418 domain-containing protein [Staphylococcus ureilyticus]UXS60656.1 DUF418 domain-containing protein [Staphylococcus ureilyticus]